MGEMAASLSHIKRAVVSFLWAVLGLVSFMGVAGLAGWVEPLWKMEKGIPILLQGATNLILMAWPANWIQEKVLSMRLPTEVVAGKVGDYAAYGIGVILLPVFIACVNSYTAIAGFSNAVGPIIVIALAAVPLSALISALIVGAIVLAIRRGRES